MTRTRALDPFFVTFCDVISWHLNEKPFGTSSLPPVHSDISFISLKYVMKKGGIESGQDEYMTIFGCIMDEAS